MNNNIRNNNNRRRPTSAKRQLSQLKRSLHGHANKLAWVSPPQITVRPWYPLVLDMVIPAANTDTYFTPNNLITALVNQLGLSAQDKTLITVKVNRVDAFTMATGGSTDRPAVSMDVSSVTPSIGDPQTPGNARVYYGLLKKLTDQGNLSDAAKVSYTWPRNMADIPLASDAEFSLISVAGNQPNTSLRVHILWTSAALANPVP